MGAPKRGGRCTATMVAYKEGTPQSLGFGVQKPSDFTHTYYLRRNEALVTKGLISITPQQVTLCNSFAAMVHYW